MATHSLLMIAEHFQLIIETHSSPVRASYGCLLWAEGRANVLPLQLLYSIQYNIVIDSTVFGSVTAPIMI